MNGFGDGMTDMGDAGGVLEGRRGGERLFGQPPKPSDEPKRGLACVGSHKQSNRLAKGVTTDDRHGLWT